MFPWLLVVLCGVLFLVLYVLVADCHVVLITCCGRCRCCCGRGCRQLCHRPHLGLSWWRRLLWGCWWCCGCCIIVVAVVVVVVVVVDVVVHGCVGSGSWLCWCCCRRHWQRLQLNGCGAAFDLQTHVMRHVHLSWHVATISCIKRSLAFGGNRRRKRHDVTARAPQFVRSCYKYDIAASNRYVRVGDLFR